MANKIIANIRRDYGQVFIKNEFNGDYMTLNELKLMIGELNALADMMELDFTQEEIKQSIYDQRLDNLWAAAVIHYPYEHPYLCWSGQSMSNRSPKEPRFSGVYLITHPDKPGLVKIGCSIDIYQRTKGLFHELGKKPVKVLGYIETDEQFDIETFLHNKFSYVCDEGEWFEYDTVIDWIKSESGSV